MCKHTQTQEKHETRIIESRVCKHTQTREKHETRMIESSCELDQIKTSKTCITNEMFNTICKHFSIKDGKQR